MVDTRPAPSPAEARRGPAGRRTADNGAQRPIAGECGWRDLARLPRHKGHDIVACLDSRDKKDQLNGCEVVKVQDTD